MSDLARKTSVTHIEDQADESAESDETTPNDITFSERPNKDDGWRKAARGSKPGDRYVRACRPHDFQRREPDIRAQRSDESKAGAGETLAFAKAGTADRRLEMKPAHQRRSAVLVGIGATTTAIVALAIATSFLQGAWLVLALIALLVLLVTTIYWSIQRFAKP
jgi:hypothetical protein